MRFAILCLVTLSLLTGPGRAVYTRSGTPALSGLEWVIGTWTRESAKSTTYEHWTRRSERTYEGESFRVVRATGDTVFAETLLLVEMAGEVFYISKVPENRYPVPFKLVSANGGTFVFENPTHDFPQRIIYTRNPDGSMTAAIEGPGGTDDKLKRIEYPFKRAEQ